MGYLSYVLNNFNRIYRQEFNDNLDKKSFRFVLYCQDTTKGFMPIDLELQKSDNEYYTIISLMPHRAKIKGTLLFDGSANPSVAVADAAIPDTV